MANLVDGRTVQISPSVAFFYGLAAMVALFVVGTTVGLIWADTSDAAGLFAGVTNALSVLGMLALVIAFFVTRRRRA